MSTHLASIDLNLLVYLDALLVEVHVTNAGKRVGLSQSAMSRALSRLRDLFEDELLIKTAHGMVLSPKAQELAPQVRQVLRQIERTIDPQIPFHPELEARRFDLCLSPMVGGELARALLTTLRERAPGVVCALHPAHEEFPLGALSRGELEVEVSTWLEIPTSHRTMTLWRDPLVTILPPGVEPPRSAREWADLPHALFHVHGDRFDGADAVLGQLGLKRRVLAYLSSPEQARAAVDQAGLCVTLPSKEAARHFAVTRHHTPPLQLPPVIALLSWHASKEHDPANRWLRELIVSLV